VVAQRGLCGNLALAATSKTNLAVDSRRNGDTLYACSFDIKSSKFGQNGSLGCTHALIQRGILWTALLLRSQSLNR
jgi:hypothetical protein